MTIGEVETRSGMTRANIRFYETEGLLQPRRLENGYRDYSEEELAVLMRIRLLRALGVPLEELRALQSGERTLSELMRRRLEEVQGEQTALDRAQTVCRAMVEDGADFGSLDAQRYLDELRASPDTPVPAAASDVLPQTAWRRFFARMLDMLLYGTIWRVILTLAFHVNTRHMSVGLSLLSYLAALVMTLLFEPVLLSRLGTTPGKWVLGFRVTDPRGERLTYSDAFSRTILVMGYGLGLNIPLLRLYRMFRSLRMLETDAPLSWEDGVSRQILRDRKPWRPVAYVCLTLLIGLASVLILLRADLPPNRGELTVAELCENYNCLQDWNIDEQYSWTLDDAGQWVREDDPESVLVLDSFELMGVERPALRFTVEDGSVTAVGFTATVVLPAGTPDGRSSEELLASTAPDSVTRYALPYIEALLTLSFAGAREDAGLTMQEARDAARYIQNGGGEDYTLHVYDLTVSSVTVLEGYTKTVTFSISK